MLYNLLARQPINPNHKGDTMKTSINSQALCLAHKINPAYSSFRHALIAAYRILRSEAQALIIARAMLSAVDSLKALGYQGKALVTCNAVDAIIAIYAVN